MCLSLLSEWVKSVQHPLNRIWITMWTGVLVGARTKRHPAKLPWCTVGAPSGTYLSRHRCCRCHCRCSRRRSGQRWFPMVHMQNTVRTGFPYLFLFQLPPTEPTAAAMIRVAGRIVLVVVVRIRIGIVVLFGASTPARLS